MVTHSKIVDPLYILHENMQFEILKKYVYFRKYIFIFFNEPKFHGLFISRSLFLNCCTAGVVAEI
jgi:hypothetical protein